MSDYIYLAVAQLNDDSETVLDLEERGWADKEVLSRTKRWTLIPKDDAPKTIGGEPRAYPIVSVAIPEGGKPVFKTRVYGTAQVNGDGEGTPMFRCYALGYKLGRRTHWVWILPTGDVEVGDDSFFANLLLARMKGAM